jgi:hypothetical protein
VADAGPAFEACHPATVTLDASGSFAPDCPGRILFEWWRGDTLLRWASPDPTYTFESASPGTATFTVRVFCESVPECFSTDDVVVTFKPGPVAAAETAPFCLGTSTVLDGSGSTGCAGGSAKYRWLNGPDVLCYWSPEPNCEITPEERLTCTLEVRCPGTPGCEASAAVEVAPIPLPVAIAEAEFGKCHPSPVTLDASASSAPDCPGGMLYEWWHDGTLVRPASPDPVWAFESTGFGTFTYTVRVFCESLPECLHSADTVVTLEDCPLAVRFDLLEALVHHEHDLEQASPVIEVVWHTASESDTLYFQVERSSVETGPFEAIGGAVTAHGSARNYSVVDRDSREGALPWYRIVEYTPWGRGDTSAAFQAKDGSEESQGREVRRRQTGRSRSVSRP